MVMVEVVREVWIAEPDVTVTGQVVTVVYVVRVSVTPGVEVEWPVPSDDEVVVW